jgi:hypothetical protein
VRQLSVFRIAVVDALLKTTEHGKNATVGRVLPVDDNLDADHFSADPPSGAGPFSTLISIFTLMTVRSVGPHGSVNHQETGVCQNGF